MPLNDRQQFEAGMRAVTLGVIDSEDLLSAIDRWRERRATGVSLGDVLLEECSSSPERQQILTQLFTNAESDDYQLFNSDGIARLKQLMRDEPEEVSGSLSDTQSATVTFDSQATHSFAGDLLQTTPVNSQASNTNETNRFRLINQVAVGGLGEIYLADDQQLHRTVAVKKIRKRHSELTIAREKFTLEAEVTGQLEHPGIVPVYALGIDESGQPFYAMRFITGQNLAERIATFHQDYRAQPQSFDGLPLRQLLRRYLDVCNALEYAHARGVVHRDLKPANIMVGEHGETLVVDWGLAKVMSADSDTEPVHNGSANSGSRSGLRLSGSSGMTRLGSFLGTLRYAPPEQLMGLVDEIDASSDVYSVGAILYEILTGSPPLDSTYRDPLDVCAALREGKLVASTELNPQTPRGLAAICTMAMAVSKQDRYATARELALDVERWLADECVEAYRGNEPFTERAGRWLRKHRSWTFAILSSLLVITLVAIIAGTLINQARFHERIARNHADEFKSDAVSRYRAAKSAIDNLVERSESLKDYPFTGGLQQQLLEEAAGVFQSLGEAVSDDPELQIERIRSMVRLADVYHMMRNVALDAERYDPYPVYESALALAHESLETRSSTSLTPVMRLALQVEIGRTLSRMALARDLDGAVDRAREAYRQAIAQLSELERDHPVSIEVAGNLAIALSNQASMEDSAGRHAHSLQLLEQSLAQLNKPGVSSHPMFALASVRAREATARALRSVGRHPESAKQLARVEADLADLLGREPNNWRYREAEASLWITAATNCQVHGDFETALSTLTKAGQAYDRLRQERPDSLEYHRGYALTRLDEGLIRIELGEPALAVDDLREAVASYSQWSSNFNWLASLRLELAQSIDAYAQALSLRMPSQDELSDIESLFVQSQQTLEELIESFHESTPSPDSFVYRAALARCQSHHAEHLARNRDNERARSRFDKALATLEMIASHDLRSTQSRRDWAYVCWIAGLFFDQQSDAPRARELFQKAAELWRGLLVDDATPLTQFYLARLLRDCPVPQLRDSAQADVLLRLARQALPNNQMFRR